MCLFTIYVQLFAPAELDFIWTIDNVYYIDNVIPQTTGEVQSQLLSDVPWVLARIQSFL